MNQNYQYLDQVNNELANISQNQLAKFAGVSPAIISNYLKQDYSGSLKNVNEKLRIYFERKVERINYSDEDILETSILSQMLKTIHIVHIMRNIGIIHGAAGIGKTIAAKQYCKDNQDAVLITASPDCKSIKGIVSNIYYTLFKRLLNGGSMLGRMAIVDRLKGSDILLLIDEAHELSNDALEELRTIHDASGCAILLIGTDEIFSRLTDRRAGRILEQMNSRIPIRRKFGLQPNKEDLKMLCHAFGITESGIIKRMERKGHFGGLRMVSNILNIAKYIAGNEHLNIDHVLQAESITGDNSNNVKQ